MQRGTTTDDAPRPAHAYYRACEGAWRGPIEVTLTDPRALASSGMGFADRVTLRMLSRWPRWLGRVVLDTSVAYDPSGRVLHTTVVRWLGLPLRRSVETITIDADGRAFRVSGGMDGTGRIDETGSRAEYELTWLGVTIHQRTVREPDVVTVVQEGPGFRSVQRLARQR